MEPMALAGMIFVLLLAVLVGGFIVLLPITRRLGLLIESKLQKDKLQNTTSEDMKQLVSIVQSLESEVRRLSERQEFTEKLLGPRSASSSMPSTGRQDPHGER